MMLYTVAQVVEKLGGVNTIAALTNTSYRAAWNWKAANKFPARTFLVIDCELRKQGLMAPASLWGMEETEPTSGQ